MPYDLAGRLVVGLASSALFNLTASDAVFREEGEAAYRAYQRDHQDEPLVPGVAFPFIRRLLSLNELQPDDPLVEVILLSRNDADTGLRVMNSIEHYGLPMTRAMFLQGASPYPLIPALNIALFLSANETDVRAAIEAGFAAGQIIGSPGAGDESSDHEVRVAFDFDGVLADDQAESVYQSGSLQAFHDHESALAEVPHNSGPLAMFVRGLSRIQLLEVAKKAAEPDYVPRLKVAIVTARSAPAHKRVIHTLRQWDIHANQACFLGGVEKRRVLDVLRPHIFFDDQRGHLDPAAATTPCVHIPFGVTNPAHPARSSGG